MSLCGEWMHLLQLHDRRIAAAAREPWTLVQGSAWALHRGQPANNSIMTMHRAVSDERAASTRIGFDSVTASFGKPASIGAIPDPSNQ